MRPFLQHKIKLSSLHSQPL